MIPRKIHLDKPAIVMELKWDKMQRVQYSRLKIKKI